MANEVINYGGDGNDECGDMQWCQLLMGKFGWTDGKIRLDSARMEKMRLDFLLDNTFYSKLLRRTITSLYLYRN